MKGHWTGAGLGFFFAFMLLAADLSGSMSGPDVALFFVLAMLTVAAICLAAAKLNLELP